LVNVARDNNLIGAVSLFLMVIAESGERKSACDNLVLKAIKKLNDEYFCHDKEQNKEYVNALSIWNSQNNGLHQALTHASKNGESTDDLKEKIKTHSLTKPEQPKGTTFLYEDATIEALTKGLYFNSPSGGIFSSEAGVVFGGHGMNKDNSTRNMATLNKLWDDDSIIVDRSDVSKNMLLTGRRLTLCLATQESTVRAFFDGTNGLARGTGFGARFLIAWPKSTQGTRLYKAPPSHWPHLTRFSNHIIRLLNTDLVIDELTGALQPYTLHLSAAAQNAWIEFYNDTEQELCTGGELTDIKDVTSKAADNVARIAALFHVYEHGITGNISEDHLRSAGRIMFWHLMESKRFFSDLSLSKELRHATMLDNWLLNYCREHQTTEISTRTIKQLCPNALRTKSNFDDAISHLIDLNRVKIVNQDKKKLLHLNPKLFEV
jgi:putative DNA primase/helicase